MDTKTRLEKEDSKINISFLAYSFRKLWWVYASVFVVFMVLAGIYCKVKTPVYDITGIIILNDDENDSKATLGGLGSLMASFSLGGSSYKYVEDELTRISSHKNLTQLVQDLGLNYQYSSKDGFFDQREPYFDNSPLSVYIPQAVLDTMPVTTVFNVKLSPDGRTADIKVTQKKKKTVYDRNHVALPTTVKTPYGMFRLSTTSFFKPGEELKMRVIVQGTPLAVKQIGKKIKLGNPSKKSDLVFIEYKDTNIPRGKAVVNHLVEIYNEVGMHDLQSQALASVEFVKGRLTKLYGELEKSENSIEAYKRANNIVNPEAEAEYIFKKKQVMETGVIEYETKASVLKMIIDFLRSDENRYALIPFTEDMPKEPVEEYNKLVMERIRLEENAKGNNTTLKTVTAQVDAMRANLLTSLERQLSATKIAIADINRSGHGTDSRISGYPTMEKDLLSLYRDQKIKNQIYAYLLQKLEENELKLSREIKVGKVIDEAYEDIDPSSPKKGLIFVMAAIGSVIAAYCGLYLWNLIMKLVANRKNNRKEENLSAA